MSSFYDTQQKSFIDDINDFQNTQALNMPGYDEMNTLYGKSLENIYGGSPDYMDKFAGMTDPAAFMQGLGLTGGDGDYGPIGADELKQFGEGAYELFDKFKPGMEYIAENQGVGEQELANMLGTSSSGYQANIENQNQQQMRNMQRMGMDPSSGAYAAGAGNRAMQGAAGLSGLQQGVRQGARQQDWSERMQAAGIGLDAGKMGTDAMGRVAGAYGDALGNATNLYGNYMNTMGNMANTTEGARQYDTGYSASLAQGLSGARPTYDALQTR